MIPRLRPHAFEFARTLADVLTRGENAAVVRQAAENSSEHKAIKSIVLSALGAFLGDRASRGLIPPDLPVRFDWEGNSRRTWPQQHSYNLLGTDAHPDAAVLEPFGVALEFDREGRHGSSFKTALMKASVHVLSGTYDACLMVYTLRSGSTPSKYLECSEYEGADPTASRALLRCLEAHGMVVAFPSDQPDRLEVGVS